MLLKIANFVFPPAHIRLSNTFSNHSYIRPNCYSKSHIMLGINRLAMNNELAGFTRQELLHISDPRFRQAKCSTAPSSSPVQPLKSTVTSHPHDSPRSNRSRSQHELHRVITHHPRHLPSYKSSQQPQPRPSAYAEPLRSRHPPVEELLQDIRALLPSVLSLEEQVIKQENEVRAAKQHLRATEAAVLSLADSRNIEDSAENKVTPAQVQVLEEAVVDCQVQVQRLREERGLARQRLKEVQEEISTHPHLHATAQQQHHLRLSLARLRKQVALREHELRETAALAAATRKEQEQKRAQQKDMLERAQVVCAALREEEEALALKGHLLAARLASVRLGQPYLARD